MMLVTMLGFFSTSKTPPPPAKDEGPTLGELVAKRKQVLDANRVLCEAYVQSWLYDEVSRWLKFDRESMSHVVFYDRLFTDREIPHKLMQQIVDTAACDICVEINKTMKEGEGQLLKQCDSLRVKFYIE
jgi:hypothetical protein